MTRARIRLEQPEDTGAVRETNEQAFGKTAEARLVDRLRDSSDCISLVATIIDRVVGHILFTPVTFEPATTVRVAGLAPMSVRPEHQRVGIGSELVRALELVEGALAGVAGLVRYRPEFSDEGT